MVVIGCNEQLVVAEGGSCVMSSSVVAEGGSCVMSSSVVAEGGSYSV